MRRSAATLFFALILSSASMSQTLPFRTYSIEEGLSEAVVVDLMQGNQGYIWVATNYGLNRFDGMQFTNYFQSDGLLGNKIYTLYQDSSGTIWVGTGKGVNTIQADSILTPKFLQPLRGNTINDITQGPNDDYWFATDGQGVWKMNSDKKLTHYTVANGLASNRVNAISVQKNGTLWFGTSKGLARLNLKTGGFKSFTTEDGLPGNIIYDLQFNPELNELWIATNRGLSRLKNGRFKNYTEKDGLIGNKIHSLTIASDNSL